jgi:hypothetical protein
MYHMLPIICIFYELCISAVLMFMYSCYKFNVVTAYMMTPKIETKSRNFRIVSR